MSTGDRPLFLLPNQRLDKVDVYAISELKEELLQRMWVDIMGPGYGLLSDVELSYSAPNLTIGACRMGYGEASTGIGGSVRHDPAIAGTGVLSLTPVAGVTGWIGFKRAELPMDEENRAYWDALANQKKVGPTNTRSREYVQLACNTSKSALIAAGYYPFLYVSGWVSTVPAIEKIHYYDGPTYNGNTYGLLFQHGETEPAVIARTHRFEAVWPTTFANRSLAQIFPRLISRLNTYMDTGSTTGAGWSYGSGGEIIQAGDEGWNQAPPAGFVQLDERTKEVVVAAASIRVDGATFLADHACHLPGSATFNWTIEDYGTKKKTEWTLANIPSNWVITGVLVTPTVSGTITYGGDDGPGTTLPYVVNTGLSTTLPLTGTGSNSLVIQVGSMVFDSGDFEPVNAAVTLLVFGTPL